MTGLWRKNPDTPEGKYPIVLRRDGSVLTGGYFVLCEKDPAFREAMKEYANKHERIGSDAVFVQDIRDWVNSIDPTRELGDPTAPPHRLDDERTLTWARRVHSGGGSADADDPE